MNFDKNLNFSKIRIFGPNTQKWVDGLTNRSQKNLFDFFFVLGNIQEKYNKILVKQEEYRKYENFNFSKDLKI